jgi:hypothetical protein
MSDPYDLAPEPPPPPYAPMEAMPVEPIGYSNPSQTAGRPGLITAIAVISIVLASLGIIGNGMTALWTLVIATMAGAAGNMTVHVPQPAPASVAVVTSSQELVGDHGMQLADRHIVLDGLRQVRPLTDQRQRLMDELLAEDGKEIVLLPGDSLTADRVAANVSDSGRLLTSRGGDNGPDYFVVGTGKIEVADDHATFSAADGSEPVRVTADSLSDGSGDPSPSGLTERQIQSIFRRIKFLGARMTPAQIQTLTQTLHNPVEQLVTPMPNGGDPAVEINSAMTMGDGSVTIMASSPGAFSTITLSPTGQVSSSMTTNTANFAAAANPFAKMNRTAPLLELTAVLANFLLAIFLLICGIMVMRQSPRGRKLHWIYVALKIPLEIFAGLAMGWFFSEFTSGVGGGAASAQSLGFSIMSIVSIVMGCVYPVALIFALSSRTVREYYSEVAKPVHF